MYQIVNINVLKLKSRVRPKTEAALRKLWVELNRRSPDKSKAASTSVFDHSVPGAFRLLTILQKEHYVDSYVKGAKRFAIDEVTGTICTGNIEEVLSRNKNELLRQARENPRVATFLEEYCENKNLKEGIERRIADLEANNALVESLEAKNLREKRYGYGRINFKHNSRKWWVSLRPSLQ